MDPFIATTSVRTHKSKVVAAALSSLFQSTFNAAPAQLSQQDRDINMLSSLHSPNMPNVVATSTASPSQFVSGIATAATGFAGYAIEEVIKAIAEANKTRAKASTAIYYC
jgi:hypothetical protein